MTVNVFPYGEAGLDSDGVQVCWPLGGDLLLSFSCPSIGAKLRQVIPSEQHDHILPEESQCLREHVDFYNSLQVFQASRFVYGSSLEFELARKIVLEHPDCREPDRVRVGGGFSKPNMPDGNWLVVFGRVTHYMFAVREWSEAEGRLTVVLEAPEQGMLGAMFDDLPHSEAAIYEGGGGSRGMREVRVVEAAKEPPTVVVEHSDAAMRELSKKIAQDRGGRGDGA